MISECGDVCMCSCEVWKLSLWYMLKEYSGSTNLVADVRHARCMWRTSVAFCFNLEVCFFNKNAVKWNSYSFYSLYMTWDVLFLWRLHKHRYSSVVRVDSIVQSVSVLCFVICGVSVIWSLCQWGTVINETHLLSIVVEVHSFWHVSLGSTDLWPKFLTAKVC